MAQDKKLYVIEARYFGKQDVHSYTVGVFDNKQQAIDAAEYHADFRGGKYGVKVFEYTLNRGDESMTKTNKELCVHEIESPYAERTSNKSVPITPQTIKTT